MDRNEQLAILWTGAQPVVAGYIRSVVRDFHQSQDVLQQTAVALVRKFDDYDPDRPFVTWAIGIAKLEILRHRRSCASDRLQFSETLIGQIGEEYERLSAQADRSSEALLTCLDQVVGRSRRALELRYRENLKPAQIAVHLRMDAGAVRVMLHRARAALRQCIERRLGGEAQK
ncbi:sigma-70 family RNA polymerase sigma factor [Planctomycetales bacterium ZRK34]|nr:sigma-70 family RNA polymerase sigma factor [Planctomycetales bacterium ZRK34]